MTTVKPLYTNSLGPGSACNSKTTCHLEKLTAVCYSLKHCKPTCILYVHAGNTSKLHTGRSVQVREEEGGGGLTTACTSKKNCLLLKVPMMEGTCHCKHCHFTNCGVRLIE